MPPRDERFEVDRQGFLVRHVVPARGQPYQHRCSFDVFEAIAHAIDEAGDAGFTLDELVAAEDVPSSQAATAIAFLKERGCVSIESKRNYPASACVHLDAMTEYHALREKGSAAPAFSGE